MKAWNINSACARPVRKPKMNKDNGFAKKPAKLKKARICRYLILFLAAPIFISAAAAKDSWAIFFKKSLRPEISIIDTAPENGMQVALTYFPSKDPDSKQSSRILKLGPDKIEREIDASFAGRIHVIIARTNGGYFLAGTGSAGKENTEILVVRTDEDGKTVWEKPIEYRLFKDSYKIPRVAAAAADDGGVLVLFENWVKNQEYDSLRAVRLDEKGEPLWDKIYKLKEPRVPKWKYSSVSPVKAVAAGNGTFLIAGSRYTGRPWALKLDREGNQVWINNFEEYFSGSIQDLALTREGGCVLIGRMSKLFEDDDKDGNSDSYDWLWIAALDPDGKIRTERRDNSLGGGRGGSAKAVASASDGGFILAGSVNPDPRRLENPKYFLMKLNGRLEQEWLKETMLDGQVSATDVVQTPDRGFLITGMLGSPSWKDGGRALWIFKTNPAGEMKDPEFYLVQLLESYHIILTPIQTTIITIMMLIYGD